MTNQDHIWHILDDVLLLLAGQHYPTPERTYKLDGGWSLALADLKRCFADLRAKLALVEAERDAARAGEARAVEALKKIFIGGNHLASALTHMLGDDFLEYETDFNQACEILNDPIKYDLWVCWAVIMRVRDSLSDPQPALDWLARQRREAAAEALEEFAYDADRIEELITCNIFDLRSAFCTRAAALRAGEVESE